MVPKQKIMGWTLYILQCADGKLYTGVTNDLERRVSTHGSGKGAKFTRGRGPYEIVFTESHETRSLAQKRETQIKKWPRAQKLKLFNS